MKISQNYLKCSIRVHFEKTSPSSTHNGEFFGVRPLLRRVIIETCVLMRHYLCSEGFASKVEEGTTVRDSNHRAD